uniref:Conjugative transposon protein TcpC n=1 Tax=Mycobacterium riyadhense TaxID=486698 RepID=A0A653F2L7_9MYCO|nr:Conjugative transposon protein TcpC [Mycobacterium riyadhense]
MHINRVWKNRLTTSTRSLGRVAVVVLVASSAINGIALLWQLMFPPQPPPIAAVSRSVINETDPVKAFATICVTSLLTGTTSSAADLTRCYPDGRKYSLPTTTTMTVSNPVAWASRRGPSSPDVTIYSVMVAVAEQPYPSAPKTTAFYQIPVAVYQNAGIQALDRIGRIDTPPPGASLSLGYAVPLTAGSPVFATLSGFVSAFLTTSGGLERFTTTDSGITPVACYSSATINVAQAASQPTDNPADNTELPVHIDVSARRPDYTPVDLSYSLTLRAVGGTWFVTQIDAIPVLADMTATPVPTSPPVSAQPSPPRKDGSR